MRGVERARLLEQRLRLALVGGAHGELRVLDELGHVGVGFVAALRRLEDAAQLRVRRDPPLVALGGVQQLGEPARLEHLGEGRLQVAAVPSAADRLGQQRGERLGRAAGREHLLQGTGGTELRIEPEHEVAAEQRLVAISPGGALDRLAIGGNDALLHVGSQRGITGVGHGRLETAKLCYQSPLRGLKPTSAPVIWLESVPNVSEGRDAGRVARLGHALAQPGVAWLDSSSDPDHHRTVFTVAGEPAALQRGLVALYAAALEEIDLRRHRGAHPRVGAVDVVPFVPLAGATMDDAVEAPAASPPRSRAASRCRSISTRRRRRAPTAAASPRSAAAASRALRREDPRPGWEPDFGPAAIHPSAGATVIGARFFLVAFNVVLDADDLALARAIAARLRTSNGGLPAVRALGVPLASRGRSRCR